MVEMYVEQIYTFLISTNHINEDSAMLLSNLLNPTYKGTNLKHLSGIFGPTYKLVDFLYTHPNKFGVTYDTKTNPIGVYAVIPPPPPPPPQTYTPDQDPRLPQPLLLPPAPGSPTPSAPKFWEGGNKRSKSRTKTKKSKKYRSRSRSRSKTNKAKNSRSRYKPKKRTRTII